MAKPPGGRRTWTVVDGAYRTVAPVEEWLEANRAGWSPNTVRSYATAMAQWWSFLEQRGEAAKWRDLGVPTVSAYLSWLRNGRMVEYLPVVETQAAQDATLESRLAALISFYRWQGAVHEVPVAGRLLRDPLRQTRQALRLVRQRSQFFLKHHAAKRRLFVRQRRLAVLLVKKPRVGQTANRLLPRRRLHEHAFVFEKRRILRRRRDRNLFQGLLPEPVRPPAGTDAG